MLENLHPLFHGGIVGFIMGFYVNDWRYLIVGIIINWRLALILSIWYSVFLILTMYFRKKILKTSLVRKINSEITASFNESFMGSNTTKTLVLEKQK